MKINEAAKARVLRIIEQIRNAGCIRFDDSPNLSDWHTIEPEFVNFDLPNDSVISAMSTESNRDYFHTLTLGQLIESTIVENKLVFSKEEQNDSSLVLFKITPISFDETPVKSEVLEEKWKSHGLGQVLSSWYSPLSDADLYDLLQDTEGEELDAVFEDHEIDIWQPFENDEKSQVCEYIANAATQSQAAANA
jgi:hypothetical protein